MIEEKEPEKKEPEKIKRASFGMLGKKHSKITKKKIRLKSKGRKHTENAKKKIKRNNSHYWLGKKQTQKHISKRIKKNYKGGRKETLKKLIQEKEKIAGRKKPEQCEICGAFGKICFDHNHETGEFRGWICKRCNTVLGFVKDDSELLVKLSKYLN